MTQQGLRLSVVMPTFNEEEALPFMVEDIRVNTSGHDCEILIVDSSSDETPHIARQLDVKVISQPPQGHGLALRAGLLAAIGDYVFTSDCDRTYPMDRLPDFLRLLAEEHYDIVSGNRLSSKEVVKAMPMANLLANRAFGLIVRLLYGIPTHDVSTGMFGMRRKVIHAIDWQTNYSFPAEIIIRSNQAGFRYKEIPIAYRPRVGEVTLNRWRSGKAYLKCFLNFRFNLNLPPSDL